jgi:DNA-binding HxlR family transcriptional regulator
MAGAADPERRSDCPISVALDLLGDAWSLLIVRDLMFKGCKTFKDFLEGGEGIASNVLAARLKRLEAAGIIISRADPDDARRRLFALTEMGIGLAPVLLELVLWSAAHFRTAAPRSVTRRMAGEREAFLAGVRHQWADSRRAASAGGAGRKPRKST